MWRGAFVNLIKQAAQFNLAYLFSAQIYEATGNQRDPSFFYFCNSFLCSLLVYPLEVVKTRYMTNMREMHEDKPYSNINSCLKESYKKRGFKGVLGGVSVASVQLLGSLSLVSLLLDWSRKSFEETHETLRMIGSIAIA